MLRPWTVSFEDVQGATCHSRVGSDLFVGSLVSRIPLPTLTFSVSSGLLYLTDSISGSDFSLQYMGQNHDYLQGRDGPILSQNGSALKAGDITHDVTPLKCHSHNDYWRRIPLYEALHCGCISVEADIWLTDMRDDSELYVGHSMSSLKQGRTLRSMYIDPLLELLDATNRNNTSDQIKGVFDTAPAQALILLIDIKNKPGLSYDALSKHIEPFRARNYLTYHNESALVPGPLTIVATGSTPYASILAQPPKRRDIFFDAPLDALTPFPIPPTTETDPPRIRKTPKSFQDYNTTTSLYASASLRHVLGPNPFPFFFSWSPTSSQLDRIRSATAAAHSRGLQVRWWDTPAWPRSKTWLWRFLIGENADVLNVDDLSAAGSWEGW